jgi:large conductance mechanosensitive channel
MFAWIRKIPERGWVKEFKTFMMRGNVIDLAVGIVIGAAFKKVVDVIVDGILMPIVNAVTLGYDFQNSMLNPFGSVYFKTGAVFQECLSFIIIGFFLFLVIKATNSFMKKEEAAPPEPTASEKLLTEIRDLLKAK